MKKIKLILLSFSILSIHMASSNALAAAAVSPLAISIVKPIQFPSEDFSITGARLSLLWGKHRDVYGLDFGLLGNITEQTFTGLSVSGLFNITHGTTTILGLQLAGLANVNTNKTNAYGLQLALLTNYQDAASSIVGVQVALANLTPHTDVYGLQVGLYNKAQSVHGLQIGIVNSTSDLHGIQIGLVNFNEKGMFGVSPILNIGF